MISYFSALRLPPPLSAINWRIRLTALSWPDLSYFLILLFIKLLLFKLWETVWFRLLIVNQRNTHRWESNHKISYQWSLKDRWKDTNIALRKFKKLIYFPSKFYPSKTDSRKRRIIIFLILQHLPLPGT